MVSVTTTIPVVPSAPTITSITPTNNQISINFSVPTSNGGATITDYKYSLNNGSTFESAGTITSPITVTGLAYNTTYQVIIRAVNSVGDGELSNMVSVTTPITGSLNYSFTYTGTGLTQQLVLDKLPIKTLTGKFTITSSNITIVSTAVNVEIVTSLYEGPYTTDFGITFNFNSLTTFYNGSTSNLRFISSNNVPFSRDGNQFFNLTNTFNIQSGVVPYFLPQTFLTQCFRNCINFNSNISNWNTSNVTNMSFMFNNARVFNQPINRNTIGSTTYWDTSSVTDMQSMFSGAYFFNKNISLWNTSNVTNMNNMFVGTNAFNQNIGNWNTSNVTNMQSMFQNAQAFNNGSTALNWNTSNVTNMSYMFTTARVFNQPINRTTIGSTTYWDTSNVTTMESMFAGTQAFNQNISLWNTSNVTNMNNMFDSATAFNQNIGNWDTSNVTGMINMFSNASAFNNGETTNTGSNPLNWNTSKVTGMDNMFNSAITFNQPINTSGNYWNTSNVTNMNSMFVYSTAFNKPIGNWNVSKVTDMSYMFYQATNFKQNISNWTPYDCTTMDSMFEEIDMNNPNSATNQNNYNALLNSWGTNPKLSLLQNSVTFGAGLSKYTTSTAGTARLNLTKSTGSGGKGWTITDGGGV